MCVKPVRLDHYKRRHELVRAAERVGLAPAEHPATTLGRDRGAGRPPDVTRYPSTWDCPRCSRPNQLDDKSCSSCGAARAAIGGAR